MMHESDSESDNEKVDFNDEIRERADKAKSSIILMKSKKRYEQEFEKFEKWREQMNSPPIDENLLLAYFQKMSGTYVATSLWTIQTKLKLFIRLNYAINIGQYSQLQAFLHRKSKEHTPKKSEILSNEDIGHFLRHAPDEDFLLHKVILIVFSVIYFLP